MDINSSDRQLLSHLFLRPLENPWDCVDPQSDSTHKHRLNQARLKLPEITSTNSLNFNNFSNEFYTCSPYVAVHDWIASSNLAPSNVEILFNVVERWKCFQEFYSKHHNNSDTSVFYSDIVAALVHPLVDIVLGNYSVFIEEAVDESRAWDNICSNGRKVYTNLRTICQPCESRVLLSSVDGNLPSGLLFLQNIDMSLLPSKDVPNVWLCAWRHYEEAIKTIKVIEDQTLFHTSWFDYFALVPNKPQFTTLRLWHRNIKGVCLPAITNLDVISKSNGAVTKISYEETLIGLTNALMLPQSFRSLSLDDTDRDIQKSRVCYHEAIAQLRQNDVSSEKEYALLSTSLNSLLQHACEHYPDIFVYAKESLVDVLIEKIKNNAVFDDVNLRKTQHDNLCRLLVDLLDLFPDLINNASQVSLYELKNTLCVNDDAVRNSLSAVENKHPSWALLDALRQLFPNISNSDETPLRRIVIKRGMDNELSLPLSADTYNQIFDEKGNFKAINIDEHGVQIGRRKVAKITIDGKIFCIKEYPEMPGVEYATSSLMNKFMGRGGIPSILVRYEDHSNPKNIIVRPWLLTPYIEGSIEKKLKDNPQELETIQHEESIIMAMFTNPEDGSPANSRYVPGTGTDNSYTIGLDNDHSLGPSAPNSYIAERGIFSNTMQSVNVKSWLFCTDTMLKGVHVDLAKRIVKHGTYYFLKEWIESLKEVSDRYQGLFSRDEQESYMEGVPPGSQQIFLPKVVLTKDMLGRLYGKIENFRFAVQEQLNAAEGDRIVKTYLELLYDIDPVLGERHVNIFMQHPPTDPEVLEIFKLLAKKYKKDGSVAVKETSDTLHAQTINRLMEIGKGEFEGGSRLNSKTKSLGYLNIILGENDLDPAKLKENPSIYEPYANDLLKEWLYEMTDVYYCDRLGVEFSQYDIASIHKKSDVVSNLKWSEMEPIRQIEWLEKIANDPSHQEWHRLKIRGSSQLTTTIFSRMNFSNLTELDISDCPELRSEVMDILALKCTGLKCLTAKNMGKDSKGLRAGKRWVSIGRDDAPLNFPCLEYLNVSGNAQVEVLAIKSGKWSELHVDGCEVLLGQSLGKLINSHPHLTKVWGKYNLGLNGKHIVLNGDTKALTTLDLVENNLGEKGMRVLAPALQQLTTLTSLDLGGNGFGKKAMYVLAPVLKQLTALTSLNLRKNTFWYGGDDGIEDLAPALQCLTALTSLNLQRHYLGEESMCALAPALQRLTALTSLNLAGGHLGEESMCALAPALQRLTALTSLNLYCSNLAGESLNVFASALQRLTALTSFDLGWNNLGEGSMNVLASALQRLTALTSLNLYGINLGEEDMRHFKPALQCLTALTSLNLYASDLGGESMNVIAPALQCLTALTSLNIGERQWCYESEALYTSIQEQIEKRRLQKESILANQNNDEQRDTHNSQLTPSVLTRELLLRDPDQKATESDSVASIMPDTDLIADTASANEDSYLDATSAVSISLPASAAHEHAIPQTSPHRIVMITTHHRMLPLIWFLDKALSVSEYDTTYKHRLNLKQCLDGYVATGACSLLTLGLCVPDPYAHHYSLASLLRIYEKEKLSSVEVDHFFPQSLTLSNARVPVVIEYTSEAREISNKSRLAARTAPQSQIAIDDPSFTNLLNTLMSNKPGIDIRNALDKILGEVRLDSECRQNLLVLYFGDSLDSTQIPHTDVFIQDHNHAMQFCQLSTVPARIISKYEAAFQNNHVFFDHKDLWRDITEDDTLWLNKIIEYLTVRGTHLHANS
jgi:Ran GTPase-activating protein (RanGAP) involved in mRNA processing and transport